MKVFSKKVVGVTLAIAMTVALWSTGGTKVMAETWQLIDGNGTNGLNVDATKAAATPRMLEFNGTLYAIWAESSGSNNTIRVKKYDGSAWVTADNNTVLNVNPAKEVQNPFLAEYNNELYAAWQEAGAVYWQIRVKKYNGTSWVSVDGNDPANGINFNNNNNGRNVRLIEYNSNLYAMWDEALGSGINQLRVKKYNGSAWTFVDGGTASAGMNKDSTLAAQLPYPAVYKNKLYVIWSEGTSTIQTRVKAYDGTSWTFVDGNGTNGLNKDTTRWAQNASLAVYNDELYAAWSETSSGQNQIRVKKYDGSSWSFVDGDGSTGINQNVSNSAYIPRLTTFGDNLYVIWYEGTPNFRIRVKKYDGTSWTSVDGNGTGGINKSASSGAQYGVLAPLNDGLYAIWQETNGTANQIRAALMAPPNALPTAGSVIIGGSALTGQTLTGSYAYNDTDSDLEGSSTFKWYTADDSIGTGKAVIAGATGKSFELTNAQLGKYISFEVTPAAATGASPGIAVASSAVGPVGAGNAAPVATNVAIAGMARLNQKLTGSYTYSDADSDVEGTSTFKWYTADDANGLNKTAIPGAVGKTLVLKAAQLNKYIIFEVTPAAATGASTGASVASPVFSQVTAVKGDANGDGLVTPADALIITKYVQGKLQLTDEQKIVLDMDNDGDIDADDATIILNIYLGKGV